MRASKYLILSILSCLVLVSVSAQAQDPADCAEQFEQLSTRISDSYAAIDAECAPMSCSSCDQAEVDPVCYARYEALSASNAEEFAAFGARCPEFMARFTVEISSSSSPISLALNNEKLKKQVKKLRQHNRSFRERNKRLRRGC